jgi:hypothetical protein
MVDLSEPFDGFRLDAPEIAFEDTVELGLIFA